MQPNIVNLNGKDLQKWLENKDNVYVGRPKNFIKNCKWGNPYKVGVHHTSEEAIRLYERYISNNQHLSESVAELRGKNLGCWCAPNQCHAEELHIFAGNQPIYEMASSSYASAAGVSHEYIEIDTSACNDPRHLPSTPKVSLAIKKTFGDDDEDRRVHAPKWDYEGLWRIESPNLHLYKNVEYIELNSVKVGKVSVQQ